MLVKVRRILLRDGLRVLKGRARVLRRHQVVVRSVGAERAVAHGLQTVVGLPRHALQAVVAAVGAFAGVRVALPRLVVVI